MHDCKTGQSETPTRIWNELVKALVIEENVPGHMVVRQCPDQSIGRLWINSGKSLGTYRGWRKSGIME